MKNFGDTLRRYPVLMILGVSIIILIIIFLAVVFGKNGTAELDILVVPTDAKILINGEEYQNGTYDGMKAGIYDVNISRAGFDDKTMQIELKSNEKTKLYLLLSDKDGQYKYSDEENNLIAVIDEYETEKMAEDYVKKYPIMKVLPIEVEKYNDEMTEYINYRIDGGRFDDCKSEFCIQITDVTGGNYQNAVEVVRQKGYNLDEYEVVYEDESAKGKAF